MNGALRWKELALDQLLPVDEEKEEAAKAALARKLANGTANHPPPIPQQGAMPPGPSEDGDDENDENDDDDEGDEDDETTSDEEDDEEPEDQ